MDSVNSGGKLTRMVNGSSSYGRPRRLISSESLSASTSSSSTLSSSSSRVVAVPRIHSQSTAGAAIKRIVHTHSQPNASRQTEAISVATHGDERRLEPFSTQSATASGSKSTPIASIASPPTVPSVQAAKRKLEVDAPTEQASVLPGVQKKPKRLNRNPKKHPKLWLPDGNVVIEVDNIQFRLHKSRLEQHSEYFTSLFTLKQHGESKLDGALPLYLVHLTSALDFEALLFALEDAITYHLQPPPFKTVASILRASSALAFPKFRYWAIRYLENMWSDDLNDLDATSRLQDATEAVILGRNYDVPSILKRAFYELLRSGGFALEDELELETKHHTDTKN